MRFRGGWCGARGSSVLKVSEVEGSGVKRDEESRVGARAMRGGPWRRRASSDRALKGSTPHAPNICQLVSPLFSSSASWAIHARLSVSFPLCVPEFVCVHVCMWERSLCAFVHAREERWRRRRRRRGRRKRRGVMVSSRKEQGEGFHGDILRNILPWLVDVEWLLAAVWGWREWIIVLLNARRVSRLWITMKE